MFGGKLTTIVHYPIVASIGIIVNLNPKHGALTTLGVKSIKIGAKWSGTPSM